MAVPKKRTGHSAQGSRRSNWKASKPETVKCSNCGETKLAHAVCTACGYYKGKAVSLKAAVVEDKKPVKAVKEVVQEEVKTEVKEEKAEVKTAKKTTSKAKTTKKVAKKEVKTEE